MSGCFLSMWMDVWFAWSTSSESQSGGRMRQDGREKWMYCSEVQSSHRLYFLFKHRQSKLNWVRHWIRHLYLQMLIPFYSYCNFPGWGAIIFAHWPSCPGFSSIQERGTFWHSWNLCPNNVPLNAVDLTRHTTTFSECGARPGLWCETNTPPTTGWQRRAIGSLFSWHKTLSYPTSFTAIDERPTAGPETEVHTSSTHQTHLAASVPSSKMK